MIKFDHLSTTDEYFYNHALTKSDEGKMQPPKGIQQSYRDAAHSGANVMFRAKVKGEKMLDHDIPLHMTVKTFDKPEAMPLDEVKNKAEELDIHRPDPHTLKYEPVTFTSKRNGNTYYMLKVSGLHPNIQKLNEHFKGQGITHDDYMAHITINKDLHDKIKKEGIKPHEVEFSPLMIEHGAGNVTHLFQDKYSHDDHKSDIIPPYKDPRKITASEDYENLEKGAKGDFASEGYTFHHGPVKREMSGRNKDVHESNTHSIHVKDKNGNTAAKFEFAEHMNHTTHGHSIGINDSNVETAHERKGIASHAYHLIEKKTGKKIVSGDQSDDAKKLWDSPKRPFGKSEELDSLEKGNLKNILAGAAMVGTMAHANPTSKMIPVDHQPKAGSHQIEANHPGPKYSSDKMLHTIASVESNGGLQVHHKDLGGMHSGERAFGKYGLTPVIIRETIKLNQDLKAKHGKASMLSGQDMQNYMQDNPGLEDTVAAKHLNRLEHHFGQNPSHIGYAWLNGITGTNKAIKEKKDINSHWHVKKINNAYSQPEPIKTARN